MTATHNQEDVMFEIRNALYTGNYQHCITEASKLKLTGVEDRLERDVIMYRAYVLQKKYSVVLDEVISSSAPELQAIRMLAEFLANPSDHDKVLKQLDAKVASGVDVNNSTFLIMAATIYYYDQNYEAALRVLHESEALECISLLVQIYIKIDRIELARKELKRMQELDDDHTLTQQSLAMFNLACGGEKLQDAFYIYQEMGDKYGASSLLLNGQAACHIQQGKMDEAESCLQEAMNKDSNNPETLVNMIVLCQHLGKAPEVASRYISQLKDSYRRHPFVEDYILKESEFDRAAKAYAASA